MGARIIPLGSGCSIGGSAGGPVSSSFVIALGLVGALRVVLERLPELDPGTVRARRLRRLARVHEHVGVARHRAHRERASVPADLRRAVRELRRSTVAVDR